MLIFQECLPPSSSSSAPSKVPSTSFSAVSIASGRSTVAAFSPARSSLSRSPSSPALAAPPLATSTSMLVAPFATSTAQVPSPSWSSTS